MQQFDWEVPDVVIIPGGNLGNVSALGAGFDMLSQLGLTTKQPRIIVAQASAANPLYLAYQRAKAENRPLDGVIERVGCKCSTRCLGLMDVNDGVPASSIPEWGAEWG